MKRALLFAAICLLCLPLAVSAQNRKRTIPKKTTTTTTPTAASVRADKELVGNHIKNLTRFIYLLGGVARGIEEVDAAAKQGKVSQATINQTAIDKGKLVASIANWRIGMDDLEINFNTKTQLQRYFPKVSGVGQLAATAEDQAKAGRFAQSGQTLLQVVNRLTDVMLEMP